MKRFVVIVCGVCVGGLLVFYSYQQWLRSLYSGLTTDKIADLQIHESVTFLTGIGLVLIVVCLVMLMRSTMTVSTHQATPPVVRIPPWATAPETVDGTYREVDAAPQPRLPEPQRINVPVTYNNGVPYPSGAEMIVRSVGEDPKTQREVPIEVSYKYLLRFANCLTPKRGEWVGHPNMFYKCQDWFAAHGMLEEYGQTLVWRGAYPMDVRVAWLEKIKQQATQER